MCTGHGKWLVPGSGPKLRGMQEDFYVRVELIAELTDPYLWNVERHGLSFRARASMHEHSRFFEH